MEKKNPRVSVIIPVKNASSTLPQCLDSLAASSYRDFETLVINDSSTDGSDRIARTYACSVIDVTEGKGANNARNIGARHARGEILVYFDADVVVREDTIAAIVRSLEQNGHDAVVGCYSGNHVHASLISRYKNLWIRYSYLKSPPSIDWLFGAVSGIKRVAFEQTGGFNAQLHKLRGDDIEYGKRFANARLHIHLNTNIEVDHLKHHTLRSFLRNELYRSMGYSQLAMRHGETALSLKKGFVNVYPLFILSTAIAPLLVLSMLLALTGIMSWNAFIALGVTYAVLNLPLISYLGRTAGILSTSMMVPVMLIDHLTCSVGSAIGVGRGMIQKVFGGMIRPL